MWKDINGKTGYKNMQGVNFLYGNLKLLNTFELSSALGDGISIWVKPVPTPDSPEVILKRMKEIKIDRIKSLFDNEASKPVIAGTDTFKGGYATIDRIDGVRRLIELKGGNQIQLYDVDDKPVTLNPAEIKVLVIALGEAYQNLYSIRQSLIVSIREALDIQAVEDIVIPWIDDTGIV